MALADTFGDLRFVNKSVSISDSRDMRRLVVELYRGVFRLLCYAMDWFKSRRKRFLSALNKNFYDETVQDLVQTIQKTVQRVKDESQRIAHGQIKRMEGMLVDIHRLRSVAIDSRNDDIKTTGLKLENAKEFLGHSSARTLESVEERVASGTSMN